eukprot:CAMPEP_0178410284 /NCGR_PEP_ID=MMETSP0689_2-20121128/20899_1 /TAXON_ID=160604 /ORGANISM="Amphidinium massartii, Strain CS-259" /LENGTH=103 /DNA_ID=CAMNT_0020031453 /DNA_START=207 /DNA_END=519 /DNA_ORIENTATION=-
MNCLQSSLPLESLVLGPVCPALRLLEPAAAGSMLAEPDPAAVAALRPSADSRGGRPAAAAPSLAAVAAALPLALHQQHQAALWQLRQDLALAPGRPALAGSAA